MNLMFIAKLLIIMIHELPVLPYAQDALAPSISLETMQYHYGKHHQTYITNVNNMVKGTPFEEMTMEQIMMKSDGPLFNNAAQAWNHTFFFLSLAPKGKAQAQPAGKLAEAIKRDFGSFDAFKEQFAKASVGLFGSGWAWLVKDASGKLSIVQESNAGNPKKKGLEPLLTCDVWEHAYYIDYRNRRADFLASFWDIVDWKTVEDRYGK